MDIFQIGLSPRRAKTKSLVQAIWLVRVRKKAHVNITIWLYCQARSVWIALMCDDVTLFLVTSKRDLVVKISQEFKRNIVHIEHVYLKFYKMKNRQNESNKLVLIPTKPRFGIERIFCDVILHKCYFQQTCSICTIFLLNSRKSSPPSLVLMLPVKLWHHHA